MKKGYWKVYAFFIVSTLIIGGISGLISSKGMKAYDTIEKSSLTPPGFVFPIVWSVLFVLMGISAARVFLAKEVNKGKALGVYILQLFFNFLWSPVFFNLRAYGFAFVWLMILWVLIIVMIYSFYKIDKPAAFLQIPYLLWVTFAAYLNYTTWMLNR